MSLDNLSTANLEALISLVKKRESLQIEIAKVEEEIQKTFGSGSSSVSAGKAPGKARGKRKIAKPAPAVGKSPAKVAAPASKPAKAAKPAGKGKRGALKEAILAELKAAGAKGVSVKELSAKLRVKNQNLHVWFATTGKTVKGLKKTGTGIWTYTE